ncbi:DUF4376 domain-containing protein [Aeromonas sp. ASNIH2]|uniref:DUF4376 domain-containing protein n=1 Tax=Aeromonas sp. ASNIH2 TaxID=1636607 RepID=UPI000CDCB19B|nr:DUF4376 domain-containing protein [Aeromonas sp. ASNIH2]AUY10728.1 hypothetical protein C3F36_15380 [Aeromonas sp. ASNIH2]
MKFYSKETNGFYDDAIHGKDIPSDAVEISNDIYIELIQSGKPIATNDIGYPIAIAPSARVRSPAVVLAAVAEKRWQVETSGIVVAGNLIKTDRESQAQISSTYTSLKSELIPDTPWKTADGTFVRVTLAQIEPIAQAVASHVRACFAAEVVHCQAIAALQTQAELDAYDIGVGWPTGQ